MYFIENFSDQESSDEDDDFIQYNNPSSTLHLEGPDDVKKVLDVLGISSSLNWDDMGASSSVNLEDMIEDTEIINDCDVTLESGGFISDNDEWLVKSQKR